MFIVNVCRRKFSHGTGFHLTDIHVETIGSCLIIEIRQHQPDRGAKYCDQPVCLCVCLSVREHISRTAGPIFTNFVYIFAVAVARSSSGVVALRYVLPVLWMTSRLAVMGATPKRGGCCTVQRRPWTAWRYRGGVWCLWTLASTEVVCVVMTRYTPCLKKTVQNCFCQNFVKFLPILIIFGRKMTKRLKLCDMHLLSASPNLCRHTTALNVDVLNCHTTPKVVICNCNKLLTT